MLTKTQMTRWIGTLLLVVTASPAVAAPINVEAFLEKHCFACHGPKQQKADRRFDQLPAQATSLKHLELFQEIVDQLNLEEMPPEDAPQPSDGERAAVIESLTSSIATARAILQTSGGHSVLRRLNSWEYRQTIGDLFSLNIEAWNPAADFPKEVKVDGFDNNGAELVTSGMLLEYYLGAAEEAINRSTHFGEQPQSQRYAQRTPFYFSDAKLKKELPKLFHVDRFRFTPETPYTDLYGRHYRGGHIGFLPLAYGGVPHSGIYTVRVRAAAIDRVHPYGDKAVKGFRNGDPLVLELAAVDRKGSSTSSGNVSQMQSLALVELSDPEPQWLEWDVYIPKGFEPEVRFRNGTTATKALVRLMSQNAAEFPEIKPFADMKAGNEKSHGLLKVYRGPKLRIWEIQVEGPHFDQWPTRGHQLMYGDLTPEQFNRDNVIEHLRQFATTAYRRPLEDRELVPIDSMVLGKIDQGMAPIEALQLGYQTVLCAPAFLYLSEGEGKLTPHTLASRLSYFLWSSPPDDELLAHAANGRLVHADVLAAQVDRLLADEKSNRFVTHFIRRWLELDNIGEMPPSEDFVSYYRDNLETHMRHETETFFRHILDHNLPTRDFIAADYSFLNRELAAHYGIEGVSGNELQRVSLAGTPRGGLLGHGSFLTASANGVDTSPVVRGIYLLEKLLGYSPPPPPPDVPTIEPDIRGAATIREQLVKHRESKTCAECHRKIDPMGFALENFDPVGGWREQYETKTAIDSTGQLPNGERFEDLNEFRRLILNDEDRFTLALTEKLMGYALGRKLEISDRPAIDTVLAELDSKQGGLRDLIRLIVLSKPFQSN